MQQSEVIINFASFVSSHKLSPVTWRGGVSIHFADVPDGRIWLPGRVMIPGRSQQEISIHVVSPSFDLASNFTVPENSRHLG